MNAEASKQLIKDYLEALSGKPKPREILDRYVDDQALIEHIELFEASFPRYELSLDDMLAEENRVAIRATFRGTHTAAFQGIQATGKDVTTPVMLIYRIDNGKIVEHWMNADVLGLLQQLGAIPVPA